MRVVVGMSGGVDSSVAALRLLEAGHQVLGVHLQLAGLAEGEQPQDPADARLVAGQLGIPLVEHRSSDRFGEQVLRPTLERYAAGLTPSPCVVCNPTVKLAELLRLAADHGAEMVATGHYARVTHEADGTARLLRAADRSKDQSYFLHRLGQDQLQRLLLPLGTTGKEEVRRIAAGAGLPVAAKEESQELCFVPAGTSYAELLERRLPGQVRPGAIVDRSGRHLGRHGGVHRFTVGQRRGIGVAAAAPLYVLELRPATGEVVVGGAQELLVHRIMVEGLSWLAGRPPTAPLRCTVQVRSRHRGVLATVVLGNDTAVMHPAEPLRAPAPGQAAVLYQGDEVLGGGWISR